MFDWLKLKLISEWLRSTYQ